MPQNTINPTKLKDIFSNGKMLVLATLSAHPLYITARNQYCYRMNCTFESGRRKMVQTNVNDTEAEAEAMYPVYKKQVERREESGLLFLSVLYRNSMHTGRIPTVLTIRTTGLLQLIFFRSSENISWTT